MGGSRVRSPAVDDRGLIEVGGLVDHPAAVRVGKRRLVSADAALRRVDVDVESTDGRVQVDELRRSDLGALERTQPVLDAHIVHRDTGEAVPQQSLVGRPHGAWALPEHVDR